MGKNWSQPTRVEDTEHAQLSTSRTVNSALWFVNNKPLEKQVLAYLAKYVEKYDVHLYAFVIVGNHYHIEAEFPGGNRAEFFRDFNARFAETVRDKVPEFLGGPLFERRYTPQVLPLKEDVEDYFYYCALQPVSSGLCMRISEYDAYNSFSDAVRDITRKFKLLRRGEYNAAKRYNPDVSLMDFTDIYELSYKRLPGYEELSHKEYINLMHAKLEKRRSELIEKHLGQKKSFLGREALREVVPGTLPLRTKKGGARPLVLSRCQVAKQEILNWYFGILSEYKIASDKFRRGNFSVEFPIGTYRPPGVVCYGGT